MSATPSSVITRGLLFTPSLIITDGYGVGGAPVPPVIVKVLGGHYGPPNRKKKKKLAEVIDYWPIQWPTGPREWEVIAESPAESVQAAVPLIARPLPQISRAVVKALAARSTAVLGNMDLSAIMRSHEQRIQLEAQRIERQRQRDDEDELMVIIGIIEQ